MLLVRMSVFCAVINSLFKFVSQNSSSLSIRIHDREQHHHDGNPLPKECVGEIPLRIYEVVRNRRQCIHIFWGLPKGEYMEKNVCGEENV